MIIALGEANGGAEQAIILGLSKRNVESIMNPGPDGKPRGIKLTRQSHGRGIPEGWQIVLVYGETEAEIVKNLKDIGALCDAWISMLPFGAE
jgi:hypothetical protein